MHFINKIEGATAWLKNNGVFRQVDLYRRGDNIYAAYGGGYVRLSISGATSHPKVTWVEADPGEAHLELRDGRMPRFIADEIKVVTGRSRKAISA